MQAGKLRHLVLFEELQTSTDADGALVETWVAVFPDKLRARVEALSGRELLAAAAINSRVSTRMVLRYREGFSAKQRATLGGTVYNIEAVIPDPHSRVRHVTLLCSSGTNLG